METDNNAVEDFPEVHCSGTIYKQCKTQIEKKRNTGQEVQCYKHFLHCHGNVNLTPDLNLILIKIGYDYF